MKKGILFPCDVLEQFPCIWPCCRGKCQGCPVIAAKRNPFIGKGFSDFWLLSEQEWAEYQKKLLYYAEVDCGNDEEDEEDFCDYNGEICIGSKLFCEECPVMTDEWEGGE